MSADLIDIMFSSLPISESNRIEAKQQFTACVIESAILKLTQSDRPGRRQQALELVQDLAEGRDEEINAFLNEPETSDLLAEAFVEVAEEILSREAATNPEGARRAIEAVDAYLGSTLTLAAA